MTKIVIIKKIKHLLKISRCFHCTKKINIFLQRLYNEIYVKIKLGAGIFGGEGFVLQKFSGDGVVFLEIDGEVIERTLEDGETLLLDPGHVAVMEETVKFDVERVKGAKNILFGEGLFFTKVTGPGKIWIQTMPISKLAEALIPFIPKSND